MNITNYDMYNSLTDDDLNNIMIQIEPNAFAFNERGFDCIHYDYKYDTRPQVRYKGIKYYISVVVTLYKYRKMYPEYQFSNYMECSHYKCHDQECGQSDHLCIEHSSVNKSRICCRLYGHIPGYNCPNLPACIKCSANRIFI